MNQVIHIKSLLRQSAANVNKKKATFYKTGVGQYAQHDKFIGVSVPTVRKIAKEFQDLSLPDIQIFLDSSYNEERLLALIILIHQYQQAKSTNLKDKIFQFYLDNLKQVNNWNLVDSSAHVILGAHLANTDKNLLVTLAESDNLWERRIAIVSTWYFIRQNNLEWTFIIAKLLLNDSHDLIHKAVGWMLREAGKRSIDQLKVFLDKNACYMPRTMLRYAIEKFPERERKFYLKLGK